MVPMIADVIMVTILKDLSVNLIKSIKSNSSCIPIIDTPLVQRSVIKSVNYRETQYFP